MKLKLKILSTMALTGIVACSVIAQDLARPDTKAASPPDKEKLSYAFGMHIGMQLVDAGTKVDASVAIQAVKDVLEGKPTRLQEPEIAPLLNSARADGVINQQPTDKEKFSYAGGMLLALKLKHTATDVNPETIAQAIKDVLDGKPTKMQPSEMEPLLAQAQAFDAASKSQKNKGESAVFLARNAKEPGVNVLPDGLQYKIVQDGTGPAPTVDDLIFIRYRGTFVNGVEFDHHDRFLTRINGGIKGWQEALQRMKVGSKWQIFVPSDLAFGHEGESYHHIGPDTALIYDLELVSIAGSGEQQVSSGVGHGLDVGVATPTPAK